MTGQSVSTLQKTGSRQNSQASIDLIVVADEPVEKSNAGGSVNAGSGKDADIGTGVEKNKQEFNISPEKGK